jgi:hypothetical protein
MLMQENEENLYSLADTDDLNEETLTQILIEAAQEASAQERATCGEFLMGVRRAVFDKYNK